MNARFTSLPCPTPGLPGSPTGTQYPSHSGRDLKTQSTKSGLAQSIRNNFRSLQRLPSRLCGSWVGLKRRGGTRTRKQEQVTYSSVAENSMAKPPLPAFRDDEEW